MNNAMNNDIDSFYNKISKSDLGKKLEIEQNCGRIYITTQEFNIMVAAGSELGLPPKCKFAVFYGPKNANVEPDMLIPTTEAKLYAWLTVISAGTLSENGLNEQ